MTHWFGTFKNWRFDNVLYSYPLQLPLSYTDELGASVVLIIRQSVHRANHF